MPKYEEAHLMSKRMLRSEDNWKELVGKSSAKWSLMSGHLCEEPFDAEDALGSLKQVSLSPFYPKIREIGAVRLSNRGETPTPFPPLPPSSPCPGDFHRAEHTWRTQRRLCNCSLQAGCPLPGKRQLGQNNQNLGSDKSNLYTNTIRTHHSVRAVCRLDAHTLASASYDKTIKIWDFTKATCTQTLSGHTDYVFAVCRLDAHTLASASDDETIKIWDLNTATCTQTLSGHTSFVNAVCRLDAHTLASASDDETIKIWDLTKATCTQTLKGHTKSVTAVCRLDANTLASAGEDKTIKIWDVTTGTCTQTLKGHSHHVRAVCRLDAHTLASASMDKTIKIWDLTKATCTQTLSGHTDYVFAVCRLDAHTLASASYDNTIKIWKGNQREKDSKPN